MSDSKENQDENVQVSMRGLSIETYLDELPFHWDKYKVDRAVSRLWKRSAHIFNRQHRCNHWPEE